MTAPGCVYPVLVTIDVPAASGRPRRTFQGRVEEPLGTADREKFEQLLEPMVATLLEHHPEWDRRRATLAACSLVIERLDDLATYERVSIEKGLLPL